MNAHQSTIYIKRFINLSNTTLQYIDKCAHTKKKKQLFNLGRDFSRIEITKPKDVHILKALDSLEK